MTSEQRSTLAGTSASQSGMTREQIVAFFERRQEAFEDLDAKALADDYTEDAVIESPIAGVHTAKDVEKAYSKIFEAFLDLTMTLDELVIDGDVVVTAMTSEGTLMREFMGIEPTGKQFRMTLAFVHRLRDGKIAHERRIYDFTGLLVQIGVLKARPA
jgi:steroid delta-isomerase-like uncharacterized protein